MRWGWAMSDARAPPRDWAVNRQTREEKKWHAPQAGTRRAVWGFFFVLRARRRNWQRAHAAASCLCRLSQLLITASAAAIRRPVRCSVLDPRCSQVTPRRRAGGWRGLHSTLETRPGAKPWVPSGRLAGWLAGRSADVSQQKYHSMPSSSSRRKRRSASVATCKHP
jgi:hypothetical protein